MAGVAFALTMASGVAWAGGPGDHIQAGPAEITPEITAGVEAWSNAYRANPGRQLPGFTFTLVPRLKVELKHPKVNWDFDGRYELRKFFDQALAEDLDQFSNFGIKTRLQVLPQGVFGFTISESARLQARSTDQAFRNNALISQLRNDLGLTLDIRPGPEFLIQPGVSWGWHNYTIPGASAGANLGTRNTISPGLGLAWNFFPSTAFIVEGRGELNRWGSNWVPTDLSTNNAAFPVGSQGEFRALPDSDFLKVVTGVRGRFTKHLTLVATVGYGFGFYLPDSVADESAANPGAGNEADPAIAGFDQNVSATDAILVTIRPTVDLGYTEQRTFGQRIVFGYRKDFIDSFFTNYLHQHVLELGLSSRWGRFVGTNLGGQVGFENYYGEIDRTDIFPQAHLDLDILPTKFLLLRLGVRWQHRFSDDTTVEYDNVVGVFQIRFQY